MVPHIFPEGIKFMVLLRVRMRFRSEQVDQVLASVRRTLEPTRVQSGCLDCRTYVCAEDPETVLYLEEWRDMSVLKKRLQDGGLKVLMSVMEFARDKPEVRLENTETSGAFRLLAPDRRSS
jgi:quinol monooxygenase YgiN